MGPGVHTCNLSTQEVEAGKLQVQGQAGLQSENLSQKKWINKLDVRWVTPVILAIWEAKIRRIAAPDQPWQIAWVWGPELTLLWDWVPPKKKKKKENE
jgi:hypothetical protein